MMTFPLVQSLHGNHHIYSDTYINIYIIHYIVTFVKGKIARNSVDQKKVGIFPELEDQRGKRKREGLKPQAKGGHGERYREFAPAISLAPETALADHQGTKPALDYDRGTQRKATTDSQ
jgi:hypothetical protein